MGSLVGKRKRTVRPDSMEPRAKDKDAQKYVKDAFQRAFEARFKPLERSKRKQKDNTPPLIDTEAVNFDDESEWEGLGSVEDEVQVIEHQDLLLDTDEQTPESKAFMTHKPPSLERKVIANVAKTRQEEPDDAEQLNLKHDLALQRLIDESHLLDPHKDGKFAGHRQRVTDLRLKKLGSKTSIIQQEKMPMSHRKGIVSKANEREDRRRREAKENGIILEKPAPKHSKSKNNDAKRVRGVSGAGVGKFKGGTLSLSKKDLASVKGSSRRRSAG